MKKPLLTFFTFITTAFALFAANETEPNNTFQQANETWEDTIMNGTLSNGDFDYFISVPDLEGTLKIYYTLTNISTATSFSIYTYNKSQSNIGSQNNYNLSNNYTDSLIIYCRQADTLYIRLSANGGVNYSFYYTVEETGISDTEPNNTFAEANFFPHTDTAKGRIGYYSTNQDDFDYYYSVLPDDGTLRIYLERINTSNSTGSISLYTYNNNQSNIGSENFYNQLAGTVYTDTLDIYCRQADTVYFRVSAGSSSCFSYQLSYEVISPNVADIEPNNSFTEATLFDHTDTVKGRIGYHNTIGRDEYDFYYSVLPDDGTLRVYLERTNTSNSTGTISLYTYNSNESNIGSENYYNQAAGNTYTDTLDIYCRQADTVYFRVGAGSSSCFTYNLRYEVISEGENDIEPNNTFAEANPFNFTDTVKGRIGYNHTSGADQYDYYYSVLPDDGTLRVYLERTNTSNSTGTISLYTYNSNQSSIGLENYYNQLSGTVYTDTLDIYCRQADTVYFRVGAGSSSCFTYNLSYEVISQGENDSEPNNTFAEANPFNFTDTVKGRIGYNHTSGADQFDYYYSVLPDDGTLRVYLERTNTSNSTGSISLYTYNSNQSNIGSNNYYNQLAGNSYTDTLDIYCRQADTVYFRVGSGSSSSCFTYNLSYEVISEGENDIEPNDTRETAHFIALTDTIKGRIGYKGNTVDQFDFYGMILPEKSSILTHLNYINTSNTTSTFNIYFYDKNGSTIRSKNIYNVTPGPHEDTIMVNCSPEDSIYVRISSSGCFSYDLNFDITSEQPRALISAARTGNEYGFVADTSNTTSFQWDLGNGTISERKYESVLYEIGSYDVILTATKNTCNIVTKDSLFVEIKGVESYNPKRSGAGGDIVMTIYGGGLDTTTNVTLKRGNIQIPSTSKITNSKHNALTVNFDLHYADEGVYDVIIDIEGMDPIVYEKGFHIEEFMYPECSAEVIGPSLWRINRETLFELKVTNEGNVDAIGAIVAFAYPKDMELEFLQTPGRMPVNDTTVIEMDGETFSVANILNQEIVDSAMLPIPIDTFQGEAFDGYMYLLNLPKVPANSTVTLPFNANAPDIGEQSFRVHTYKVNLFGSCETPHWSYTTNAFMAEAIDGLDMTIGNKNALTGALTKSLKLGHRHLENAGAYMGFKFDSWWNGYDMNAETYGILNAQLDEANAYLLNATGELILEKATGAALEKYISTGSIRTFELQKVLNSGPPHLSPKQFNKLQGEMLKQMQHINGVADLWDYYDNINDMNTLLDKLKTLRDAINDDCPEIEKQLKALEERINQEMDPNNPNDKKTNTVASLDPNEIYGPEGVLEPKYRNGGMALHYMVSCENVDTASAPAQEVKIVDTLNPNHFDLSTFEFGAVYIGNKSVKMLNNRDEFYGEIDLFPEIPLKAKVIANIDTVSGAVAWYLVGIDTTTGDLPINPLLGILPPNTNPPFGEAMVTYTVNLRKDLPSGTQVDNYATIYFDDNDPIITNTWSNTLDIIAPESNIIDATIEQDTLITLQLNGTDDASGIYEYIVYVNRDQTEEWLRIGTAHIDTMAIAGIPGETYHFYCVAKDYVGNVELKNAIPEVSITVPPITGIFDEGKIFSVYPNPTNGFINLVSSEDMENTQVSIIDLLGKRHITHEISFTKGVREDIDISQLTNGVYFVHFTNKDLKKEAHKILLRVE